MSTKVRDSMLRVKGWWWDAALDSALVAIEIGVLG